MASAAPAGKAGAKVKVRRLVHLNIVNFDIIILLHFCHFHYKLCYLELFSEKENNANLNMPLTFYVL